LRFVFTDRRDIAIGSNGNVAQIAKVKDRLRRIVVIFSDFVPKSWPSRKATRALRSAFSSLGERMIRVNRAASCGKGSCRSGMTDPTTKTNIIKQSQ
jgi:hypothetical protein